MKGIQDTSNKTYRQLMGNGLRYEIPKFQRDYTWETDQWDDLWQDIQLLLSKEETEHYMGYLVLQTVNNKNYAVIDGQQRLTTMSLILLAVLKCLNNLAEKGVESDNNIKRRDNLQNSYIGYVDPVTLISNNKLKLNRNSDDYYKQYLVLLKELPLRNTNASEKHMRDCFLWFFEKVKNKFKTGEELAFFVETISDKIFFTVIEVSDQLNAFKVFETLNARGVQLSASDLLKNHLFSVVDETQPHMNELTELENIWTSLIDKLGEQKLEDYLRYFWNSSHKSVAKKQLFKTIKQNISTKAAVFNLVRDLKDTADVYLAVNNPEDEFWKSQKETRDGLNELKLFQIKQTNSLLLSDYKNLDAEQFKKLVKCCSVISFRYNVIGGLNPNEQESVYNHLALQISQEKRFDLKLFQSVYVSDVNFENDFSSKVFKNNSRNHKIVKYILAKIEEYRFKNEISTESDLFRIEHILPESADETWGGFTQEEIERSVFRLGNLTLLEKKLNHEADKLVFDLKLKVYEKSNCQLTKSIVENYQSWTERKMADRQKQLAKDAKVIWRIQELNY
jgi:uncharacterized protein with ParB-like and HNH nuclease domain